MTRSTRFSFSPARGVSRPLAVALMLLLAVGTGAAQAQAGASSAAADADAQIEAKEAQSKAARAAERARVEKYYRDKLAECHARFAVTGCDEDLRAERIEALRPLQKADQEANARERLRRAEAQRARVLEKDRQAAADEARRKTDSVRAVDRPASGAAALPPARAPRANSPGHQRQVEREAEAAQQKAAERRQAAEARRQKAQEQARKAQALEAKRAAKPADTKRPAPAHLPTPSASDIQALPPR